MWAAATTGYLPFQLPYMRRHHTFLSSCLATQCSNSGKGKNQWERREWVWREWEIVSIFIFNATKKGKLIRALQTKADFPFLIYILFFFCWIIFFSFAFSSFFCCFIFCGSVCACCLVPASDFAISYPARSYRIRPGKEQNYDRPREPGTRKPWKLLAIINANLCSMFIHFSTFILMMRPKSEFQIVPPQKQHKLMLLNMIKNAEDFCFDGVCCFFIICIATTEGNTGPGITVTCRADIVSATPR